MEFLVKFSSHIGYVISTNSTESVGLKDLDAAREKIGVNIPAKLLIGRKRGLEKDPFGTISEEFARISGKFDSENSITVRCKPAFLNEFVHEEFLVSRNSETDEIQKVEVVRTFNFQEILQAWQYAGFPIKWEEKTWKSDEDE